MGLFAVEVNGWRIYFIRRLFGKQRRDLQFEVHQLKKTLSREDYLKHPMVKLYTAIMVTIKEKIPDAPFASKFVLIGALKKYGRVKHISLFAGCISFQERKMS